MPKKPSARAADFWDPTDGDHSGGADSIVRPVVAIVVVSVTISWLILTVLDLRANNGIAPVIAMFAIPALAASVIIQIGMMNQRAVRRSAKPLLWWVLAVLPLGTLGGFVVALFRDPEYFVGDDGPWMLVWVPIFVFVGLLIGSLVWFFFVYPLVALVKVIGSIARGAAKPSAVIAPLVLLSLGVLCIVGGLSIDTENTGRLSWGAIIASILGIPGAYDVLWEPGLWIVRGIIAAIILVFGVPALARRVSGRSQVAAD